MVYESLPRFFGKGEKFASCFLPRIFVDFLQIALGNVGCHILSKGEMGGWLMKEWIYIIMLAKDFCLLLFYPCWLD